MRLRGYDEETEELSEDLENISGDIADLTKTASTPGGISLFTDATKSEYKSTYQILKEISEIWDELTDKQQAQLLEKLAGKRGGQVVAGLLENFDSVEKALDNMEGAAGSADDEMSIIQDSLDYKLNALKETWVGIIQDMIDRGDLGKIIDALTKLSEAISKVLDVGGLLPTIFTGVAGVLGVKGSGFVNFEQGFSSSFNKIKEFFVGNGFNLGEVENQFIGTLKTKKGEITEETDWTKIFSNYDQLNTKTRELVESNKYAGKSFTDLGKEIEQLGKKSGHLGTRLAKFGKSLGASLLSGLANAGIAIAVSALVSGIAKTIDQAINGKKYMREASAKFTDAYIGNKNDLESLTSQYEELSNKLHDTALSTDEYKQVKEQLSGVQDQIIDKFGKEAEGIDLVNGKYEDQLEILQNISQQEATDYVHKNSVNIEADRKKIGGQKVHKSLETWDFTNKYEQTDIDIFSKFDEFTKTEYEGYVNFAINTKMTLEEQYNLLNNLMNEIDKTYGENKPQRIKEIYNDFSAALNSLDMEGYYTSFNNVQAYAKAQVLQNPYYAKSYRELIDAVYQYQEALSNNEGVDVAKKNLDDISNRFDKVTSSISSDAKIVKDELFKDIITYTPIPVAHTDVDAMSQLLYRDAYQQKYLDAQENLRKEYEKAESKEFGLTEDSITKIKDGTLQSVFGNVDMDSRYIIQWSDALKQIYADELSSWDYDPEIGSIDTVFGGSDNFDGVEIAYTPILQTDKGAELLSRDTLNSYIQELIKSATADGSGWTSEELFALDAEGLIIDGKKIQNMLADIGDIAIETGSLLHFAGEYGAIKLGIKGVTEAQEQYNNILSVYRGSLIDINDLDTSITHLTTGYSSLNTALSEQATRGTLTSNSVQTLSESFEHFDEMVETTTNGIIINTDKMNKLNAQYKSDMTSKLSDKQASLTFKYEQGSKKLASYNQILSTNTKLSKLETEQLHRLIDAQKQEQDATMNEIGQLKALQLEFENTISTHNAFIDALSSTNEGAGYDAIVSGLSQVQEQWNKGLVGTDEIRAFVDYMTSTDMSNASIDEIVAAYDSAMQNAQKYFTETRSGSEQFLELLKETTVEIDGQQKALASVDSSGNWTIAIDDLKQASEACGFSIDFLQDNLQKLKEYGFDIEFTNEDDLYDYAEALKNIDSEIEYLQEQLKNGGQYSDQLKHRLDELTAQKHEIELQLNTQQVEDELARFSSSVEQIQNLQQMINNTSNTSAQMAMSQAQHNIASEAGITVSQALSLDTSNAEKMYEAFKKEVENDKATATVDIEPNASAFYRVMANIQNAPYKANIELNVSGSVVRTKITSILQTVIDKLGKPTSEWTGSAYVRGKGNWGVGKNDTNALVGELGTELRVRDGHYELIGEHGAEFTDVRPDDIIFNHKQTEQILKYGHINSRGKALVEGNAFNGAQGSGGFHGGGGTSSSSSNNSSSNLSEDLSSATEEAKEFKEELDWIAVGIQRCEEALERLSKVADNTYRDWMVRTEYIDKEMAQTKYNMEYLALAYDEYMKAANAVNLSEEYKKKVREGKIQLETITDEALKEAIDKYTQYYEAAMSAKDQIDDLAISMSDLAKKKFDNIVAQFEEIDSLTQSILDNIDASIKLATTKGYLIGKEYYRQQIEQEKELAESLEQRKMLLEYELDNAVKTGKVTYHSETWYEMYNKIQDVTKALAESEIKIEEYKNSIREVDWTVFDMMQEKLADVNSEFEFLNKLLNAKELTDGTLAKGLTKYGIAQLSNMAAEYDIYLSKAQNYKAEIEKIDRDIAEDPSNQTLLKRRQELLKAQQDSISAAQDEKKAMIDLARSGYDAILKSLQDIINKRKEQLKTEKDLYDYQQTVQDQTKSITDIQKQLAVYSLDQSEESRKKVQDLQNQLKVAQRELDNTQRDKQISDQTEALDKLYDNYSEFIDDKFKDTDKLFNELIKNANANSSSVQAAMKEVTQDVGYTMSYEVSRILNDNNSFFTDFPHTFTAHTNTIISIIGDIYSELSKYIKESDSEALRKKEKAVEGDDVIVLSKDALKDVYNMTLLGRKAYASGSKHLKDGFAWTNEYGENELIRTSDGALLTPVGNGGTIFTSDMSDVLWKFASNPQDFLNRIQMPNMSTATNINGGQLYIENMVLPNVTKPEDFADAFVSTLQTNQNMVKSIQSVTTDLIIGKSIKKTNRF